MHNIKAGKQNIDDIFQWQPPHLRAFNVAKKGMAHAFVLRCTLYKAGDIGHAHPPVVVIFHHTNIRMDGREWIVCNLWAGSEA